MSSNLRLLPTLLAATLLACCATAQRSTGVLPPDVVQAPVTQVTLPDETFTLPDGTRLPARVWLPTDGAAPGIVVLALHGFNDSRDGWELAGPAFAERGVAVFAPDQRGFGGAPDRGDWPGGARLVADADEMARGLRQRFPTARLFVLGLSMGGAVTMDLAASANPPPVDGYVMLAPAVWGRVEQGAVLASSLWLANGVAPDYRITGSEVRLDVHATDNRDALIRLARDPLTLRTTRVRTLAGLVDLMDSAQAAAPHMHGPALVAYGAHDDLVPAAAMGKAWASLPPETRRAVYPNGYHLLTSDLDRRAVIDDVVTWMRTPDALLPSGADIAAAAWVTTHHPGGGLEF